MAKDLRIVGPLLAAALIVARGEAAQTQAPEASARTVVFQPLIADPKEPQFFAAYLWERSARLGSRLGSVGFGQTFGVAGGRDWEVSIAAAVFSQFDLARATADLMNTDYRVGVPVTYRRAAVTVRFQLYHQSSHLGDEYMAHTNSQRVDLGDPSARPESGWRWSVLRKAYTGPAPYGEFFRDRVSSLGFGIGLAL